MISLFLINAKPLQYAVGRADLKVYNFTTQGWDALPSTVIPAAANLQAMTPFATAGPLVGQQVAQVPSVISGGGGVAFFTFTSNADGSLHQMDCINLIDIIEAQIRGGISR
jgi:hypothetical protein